MRAGDYVYRCGLVNMDLRDVARRLEEAILQGHRVRRLTLVSYVLKIITEDKVSVIAFTHPHCRPTVTHVCIAAPRRVQEKLWSTLP